MFSRGEFLGILVGAARGVAFTPSDWETRSLRKLGAA